MSRKNSFLREFLILAKDFFSKKFFGEFLSREFHSFHEDLTKEGNNKEKPSISLFLCPKGL